MTASPPAAGVLPGHPFVHRNAQGALCVESVDLAAIAREFGTPLFVYSKASMLAALAAYQRGFAGRNAKIHYACKANSSLAIMKVFHDAGCGFDIVSAGEMERALRVGAVGSDIVFSGVGKTRAEMARALDVGVACFNVESEAEIDVLHEVASAKGKKARISLRVNPNVDAKTHPYISTGLKNNKFGVAHERALAVYQHAAKLKGLEIVGIDCHIGSQITSIAPYLEAMDRVLDLVEAIEAAGIPLEHIDFGGGLGITYAGETPPEADALWAALLARVDARSHGRKRLMIEPGRSLIGNAGVCITEVLYTKPGSEKSFCIVDAAMNDLPRPAMYQAFHTIEPLSNRDGAPSHYDVVGPVCESGDWIGRDRALNVQSGDLLAVLSAGAYSMSMASNYNTRPRAAEIMVDGSQVRLIRERERLDALWRGERV